MGKSWILIVIAAVVVIAVAGGVYVMSNYAAPPPADGGGTGGNGDTGGDGGGGEGGEAPTCPRDRGLCIEAEVTEVLDGDTLDVEDGYRIRLVLVDAPELSEAGGPEAKAYLRNICLGRLALIDEDDDQIGDDPYGRVLAVVYCDGTNANAAMISSGHADTYQFFCSQSEFGRAAWTGCSSPPPEEEEEDCDPAYPTVCIPPPPPDLDCADIPYTNFVVLPPDPHHFDGDGDGVGCEA